VAFLLFILDNYVEESLLKSGKYVLKSDIYGRIGTSQEEVGGTAVPVNLEAYDKEQVDYSDPYFRLKIWTIHHANEASEQYGVWHYHQEMEWIAVVEGVLRMETSTCSYELQAGDVVMLGSNELHRSYKYRQQALTYIVCHADIASFMNPSLLPYYAAFTGRSTSLIALNEKLIKYPACKLEAFRLLQLMLLDMSEKQRGYELSVNASLKGLLYMLIKIDEDRLIVPMDPHLAEKLRPALAFIEECLEGPCHLTAVSGKLNYNDSYFAKLFKKGMGMTFTSYVQMRRMKRAEQLLLTEAWSVTEISGKVGFTSPAQFYQLFKRYQGCSPRQYMDRRMHQERRH
jgi:AraC-like DNA-binding protein/mannose-6-phosphate isomerase-like protein (cupin superfamily)